jgi:hypothetical protein
MSDLNLKLPEPPAPTKKPSQLLWRSFLGLGVSAAAVGAWWPHATVEQKPAVTMVTSESDSLPFREDWLIRLKQSGAWEQAAQMFQSALNSPQLTSQRRAQLLLEQAECYHGSKQHGLALLNLYAAEELSDDEELDRKIQRQLLEHLRAMGRFDTLSDELSRKNAERRDGKAEVDDPVVATVDGEALTLSQFRKEVDLQIESRIAQSQSEGKAGPELEALREELQKQFSVPGEQFRLLQQWVSQEVLLREAEQWQLQQHPEYSTAMERFRKQLLTSLLLRQQLDLGELDDKDLDNFIKANPEQVGLEGEESEWTAEALAELRPKAEKLYLEQKRQRKQSQFQQELMERHQVEIFRESFTEGAQ